MKSSYVLLLTGIALSCLAALPPEATFPRGDATPVVRTISLNGLYKFTKNTSVTPDAVILNGEVEGNPGGVSTDVYKDETIALKVLPSGQILMTLRLADEEAGKVPEQLILSRAEADALGLTFVAFGDDKDLMEKYSGYFATDVAGPRNRGRARRHTHRNGGGSRTDRNGRIAGGGGNCVSVVKAKTGFRGTAGNGVGMANALLRTGYGVISYSNRRQGTVCSWSGGYHGLGHTGWFDGSCFQPTYGGNCGDPGRKYRLLKCVTRG